MLFVWKLLNFCQARGRYVPQVRDPHTKGPVNRIKCLKIFGDIFMYSMRVVRSLQIFIHSVKFGVVTVQINWR